MERLVTADLHSVAARLFAFSARHSIIAEHLLSGHPRIWGVFQDAPVAEGDRMRPPRDGDPSVGRCFDIDVKCRLSPVSER